MAQDAARLVVHDHLRTTVDKWMRLDPLVRSDAPDAVHQMRVASRRLRSLLATFRPLFDAEVTDPLRDELKWYAGQLGEARDAEVMRDRLTRRMADQPAGLVLGDAIRIVVDELTGSYRTAHEGAVKTMRGRRYGQLTKRLESMVEHPPWTDEAEKPADEVLRKRVRGEWKRLRRRADGVARATSGDARDEVLHEVRKAAKRLRYATETAKSVGGEPAGELAKAAKNLQSVLGEHQDGVVTQAVLRDFAARAVGDTSFTFGRLHAQEQERTAAAGAAYDDAWARLAQKSLRRWLN